MNTPMMGRRLSVASRGSAILLSLAVLLLLLLVAIFFVSTAQVERQAAKNIANTAKARMAAESGLQRGMMALSDQLPWRNGGGAFVTASFAPQKLPAFDSQGRYAIPRSSSSVPPNAEFSPATAPAGTIFEQNNVVMVNKTGKLDPNAFGRPSHLFYVKKNPDGVPAYYTLFEPGVPAPTPYGASPIDIDFQFLAPDLSTAPVAPETFAEKSNWLWVLDPASMGRVNLLLRTLPPSGDAMQTAIAHSRDVWLNQGVCLAARCEFPADPAEPNTLWHRYVADVASATFNLDELYPFSRQNEENAWFNFNGAAPATTPRPPLWVLKEAEMASTSLADFETRLNLKIPGFLGNLKASRVADNRSYLEFLANLKDFLDDDSIPSKPADIAIDASYPSLASDPIKLPLSSSPVYCGTEATMNISELKIVGNVLNADVGDVVVELVNFYPSQYLRTPAEASAEAADLAVIVELQYMSGTTFYTQKFVSGFGPTPGPAPQGLWVSTLTRPLYPLNPHAEKKTEDIVIIMTRAFLVRKSGIWAKINDMDQSQAQLDTFIRTTGPAPVILDIVELQPLASLFLDAKTISASRNSDLYPTLKKGDKPPIRPGGLYKAGDLIFVYANKTPPPGNAYVGDPKNPQPPFYAVGVASVTNNEVDFTITADWAAMPWGTTVEVGHIYTYRGAIYVASCTHTKTLANPIPPDRDTTGDFFLKVFSGVGGVSFEVVDPRNNSTQKYMGEDAWRIAGSDSVLYSGYTVDDLGSLYYPNPLWFSRWNTGSNSGQLWSWVPPDLKNGIAGYWLAHPYPMDEAPGPRLDTDTLEATLAKAIPSTALIRNGCPRTLWELGTVNRAEPWRTLRLAGGRALAADQWIPNGSYEEGDWLLLDRLSLNGLVPLPSPDFNAWFQKWENAGCPPYDDAFEPGNPYGNPDWGKPEMFTMPLDAYAQTYASKAAWVAAGSPPADAGWIFPTVDLWKRYGCPLEGPKVNPNTCGNRPWITLLQSVVTTDDAAANNPHPLQPLSVLEAYDDCYYRDDGSSVYGTSPLMPRNVATSVADALLANAGGYWNRGQVAVPIGAALSAATISDRTREEVVGKLVNLLSPRYQYFEIRSTGRCAQMPELGSQPRTLATARIVAVVERDTYTGTVRILSQWLDEEL